MTRDAGRGAAVGEGHMARRKIAWMIARDGDAVPDYLAGSLFGEDGNWSRDPDRAFQYLRRSAAQQALVVSGYRSDPTVRIVPVFVDAEHG